VGFNPVLLENSRYKVFNGPVSWRFRVRGFAKQPEEIMSQFVNRLTRLTLAALLAVVALGSQFAAALEVGDKAPDFTLQASDGQTYSMSQFLGEKPVVIAFFPKAFTGG
jgi:hypothetical protein|tara:strand:- start:593 stop:919 length:327 start_codon:yes stop_codon:yes gene_type:complete